MRLTDLLFGIGEPLYFYPRLAIALDGVNPGLLLCRLLAWYGHERFPEIGIYKTKEEITQETGLSRREQDTAVKRLEALGLIETEYKRLEHRLYYRLNLDAINDFWDAYQDGNSPKHETAIGGAPKRLSADTEAPPAEAQKRLSGKRKSASRSYQANELHDLQTNNAATRGRRVVSTESGMHVEEFDLDAYLQRELET